MINLIMFGELVAVQNIFKNNKVQCLPIGYKSGTHKNLK